MRVQLYQLRYVVAVADEGGFTKAAAQLDVAQPSVSAGVRALEEELGASLFQRRPGGEVVLTPAGEAVLPSARQALADCDAIQTAVDDLLGLRVGKLAVGAPPTVTSEILAPALAYLHERHPALKVSVRELGSRHLITSLEHEDVDLALVTTPVELPWVDTQPLLDEEMVLAVRHDHPLAGRSEISIAELEHVPLVMVREGYEFRQSILDACLDAGFSPTIAVDGLEIGGVLALTTAGLGAGVIPISAVSKDGPLETIPFSDVDLHRSLTIVSRQDRVMKPAATALIIALRDVVAARSKRVPGRRKARVRPAG